MLYHNHGACERLTDGYPAILQTICITVDKNTSQTWYQRWLILTQAYNYVCPSSHHSWTRVLLGQISMLEEWLLFVYKNPFIKGSHFFKTWHVLTRLLWKRIFNLRTDYYPPHVHPVILVKPHCSNDLHACLGQTASSAFKLKRCFFLPG